MWRRPRRATSPPLIPIGSGRTASALRKEPFPIVNGLVPVPKRGGLGVEMDMVEVEKAHNAYKGLGDGARDDAAAMQFLIQGWKFDPKRPCLVR